MCRLAALQEKRIKGLQHIVCTHLGAHRYRQGLTSIFVEDGQHLVGAAVAQPVVDEVDRPDVVGVFRSQPDD